MALCQVVKNEVNVPVLKNFVEKMYLPTLDLSQKRKHSLVCTGGDVSYRLGFVKRTIHRSCGADPAWIRRGASRSSGFKPDGSPAPVPRKLHVRFLSAVF